jgi:hypothetical protein
MFSKINISKFSLNLKKEIIMKRQRNFAVLLFVALAVLSVFLKPVMAGTTSTYCFVPIQGTDELADGDVVSLINLNNTGYSRLAWYMDMYTPKLKYVSTVPLVSTPQKRFSVKKFADGNIGFYIMSPYVAMNYFISGYGGYDVELQQENEGDENDYKWNAPYGDFYSKATILRYANNSAMIPVTLYMYGSQADSAPSLAPGQANANRGLMWLIERGIPCSVVYTKTADWGSGFNATITITNNGQKTIKDWSLYMYFPYSINTEQASNARITLLTNSPNPNYLIQNAFWNKELTPGESATFHFSGNEGNLVQEPTDLRVVENYTY